MTERHLGVTGTRDGWTREQEQKFVLMLSTEPFTHWHHGKCKGVDSQTHFVIRSLFPKVRIVGHPSVDKSHEIDNLCDEEWDPKSHFARNRDIVDNAHGLIVVPKQPEWQSRGGTWYTHDYAVKRKKPVLIIWPDGSSKNSFT